jgi:hypothetical protein
VWFARWMLAFMVPATTLFGVGLPTWSRACGSYSMGCCGAYMDGGDAGGGEVVSGAVAHLCEGGVARAVDAYEG